MMGFDRDDEVYVNVTPNDGTDNGTTVESDHAVVLNSAPSAPSISVTSTANPPIEFVDNLDCSIVGLSTDDDGDAITYTYTWYDPTGGIDVPTGDFSFGYFLRFFYNGRIVGMRRRSIRWYRCNTNCG